jgi:glucokinase
MGFDKQARLLHSKFATQLALPETNPVNVRGIYQLAQQGDPLCVHLAEQASTAIAYLIMNLVRVTDPELVILGGGIVSDAFMLKKVQEKLNPTTIRFVNEGIVLTSLDPNFAGLIGAGAVAMNL